jgi:hypothetical protein
MTKTRFTALAAGVAGLLGLAVVAAVSNTANAAQDVEVNAFVNDSCIIADEPFYVPQSPGSAGQNAKFLPIIAAVVGQLASLFIHHEADVAAGKMKAQAARKDTRYAMVRQMNLYRADLLPAPVLRINANLGCMTIVAGSLEPGSTDCKAAYVPKAVTPETLKLPQDQWRTSRTDDSVENQLRRANVCVKGKVYAVYEARFEFSDDGTAYRLKDAGYYIESLLTTQQKGATRAVIYTLKITDPSSTDQEEVLSVAWVNIGTVSVGAHSSGAAANSAPWLRVPPLTAEARRSYEERTKVHQEVMGEIEALKRALKRNQRMLASLDGRIAASSSDVAEGLKQERTRIAVQYQTQSAELDARTAEYADLPHQPLELMPVTIEVAVTESESEKKSQLALADLIGSHSDIVTSAVGTATTGLLSRAVNLADESPPERAAAPASDLERARARYFDALTDAETAPGGASDEQKRELAAARDEYNAARRSLGLDQI